MAEFPCAEIPKRIGGFRYDLLLGIDVILKEQIHVNPEHHIVRKNPRAR